jgi:lipoate---protein ligase
MSFSLIEQSGPAAILFADTDAVLASVSERNRIVRVLAVDAPAVVLGSAQDPSLITTPFDPISVVRRRSGGGAVWLDSESMVWFDIMISSADPLWQADVGQSMWWVGDLFANALSSLGVTEAVAHRGAMVRHQLDRTICWTGLGPGEVTAGIGGPKIVGVAQKRVRDGALFQVGVLLAESQRRLVSIFGLGPADEAAVRSSESPILVSAHEIVEAVRNALIDYS